MHFLGHATAVESLRRPHDRLWCDFDDLGHENAKGLHEVLGAASSVLRPHRPVLVAPLFRYD